MDVLRLRCAPMKARPSTPLIVGPLLGWFVSFAVEQTESGFAARGQVAESESAFATDSDLPRVAVGPYPCEKLAHASLISHVRWQIENRSGPFASAVA